MTPPDLTVLHKFRIVIPKDAIVFKSLLLLYSKLKYKFLFWVWIPLIIANFIWDLSTILSPSKIVSNLIFNSSSKISNGAKVPDVKIIEYGLNFRISWKPRPGLKQNIFKFIIFLICFIFVWIFFSLK